MCDEIKNDDLKIKNFEMEITGENYVSPGVNRFIEHFTDGVIKQNQEDDAKIKSLEKEFVYIRHISPKAARSSAQSPSNFFNQIKIFVGNLLKKYNFVHDITETDNDGYYNVIYRFDLGEDYEEAFKEITEFKQSNSYTKSIGFSYNGEEISFEIDTEKKEITITCRFNQHGKKYQILEDDFIKVHTFKSCISDGEMSIVEIKLYRIQALKTFTKPGGCNPVVHVGELGGYIEAEDNLSQDGNCWVFDKARVKDGGKVLDDAIVYDKSLISKNSIVGGRSIVGGHCFVTNQSVVIDSTLEGNVTVTGHSNIHSGSYLYGDIEVDKSDIGCSVNLTGKISVKKSRITAPLELSGDYQLNFDVGTPHSVIGYNIGMPRGSLFAIKNMVASTIEDKWSACDFVGTGAELIDFVQGSDDEKSIDRVRNIVEFHKKQYNL